MSRRSTLRGAACALVLLGAASALVAAIAGGLLRACPAPVPPTLPGWLLAGAAQHAALMTGGFLGTLIGLERAVALRHPLAFLPPLASALGAALMLSGRWEAGAAWLVLASAGFVVVNARIVRRQPAAHTALLLLGAIAWLAGCAFHALGRGAPVAWWFAFLALTIAAERLEMTRLTPRADPARRRLWWVAAALLAGAAVGSCPSQAVATAGAGLFGAALLLLAAWLFVHDIARRTIRAEGLPRYMAACLLAGYAWLALAGIGWIGLAAGLPLRDLALHAFGLGFVGSMMMAHAPVILPAIAGLRLRFGPWFYLPVAVLHGSLVVRLGLGLDDPLERGIGAGLNALAVALFALTVACAALAWRLGRRGQGAREGDGAQDVRAA